MTARDAAGEPAAGFDRSAGERVDPGVLDAARGARDTRVLVIHGDRAPLAATHRLRWVAPTDAPADAEWALLGRAHDGAALLTAVLPADAAAPASFASDASGAETAWGALRTVGGVLDAADADAFVEALSLARWLRDAPHCPACGTRTDLVDAGWSRRCPACGRQHFPRTDPAVIVAVTSGRDPDLLLLGSNRLWGADRYSCFAGFVEAGESAEAAVRREVAEEAGIEVGELRYRGSQAWPYPRSLMLGFEAVAEDDARARPDGDEIVAVRWFTRREIAAGLRGEGDVALPGAASIAHRLITQWCEAGA